MSPPAVDGDAAGGTQLRQRQQVQQQRQEEGADAQEAERRKLAKARTMVMQTSLVVLAAVAASYFDLISHQWALGIIAAMCLTLRFCL